MKKLLILLLCTALPCHAVTKKPKIKLETGPKSLTMQGAVDLAIKHRPDLAALRYATQASKSAAKGAIAGYYPAITINSKFSQDNTQVAPANLTLLDVEQTVFSFSGPQVKYRIAKKSAEADALEEDIKTQDIRLATEKAFLNAYLLQEKLKSIKAQHVSSQATYNQASHANKVKRLDKDAWLGSTETYANDLSAIYQYDTLVDSAFRTLEFLTGQQLLTTKADKKKNQKESGNERAQLVWHHKKEIVLEKIETYYDYALANRPEIKKHVKYAEMEHENIRLHQGERLPSITASAQVGFDENRSVVLSQSQEVLSGKTFWNYTAGLSWTLFDGMVSQHAEQQARANRMKNILNKQQEVLNVKQAVQDAYSSLLNSLIAIKAQKINYVHAHNSFKLAGQKYKLGRMAAYEFKTAETSWERAQLAWTESNVNVAQNEQALLRACGYPTIVNG